MTEGEPSEESTEESQEDKPKISGSGFIGAVKGSGRPQPDGFEETAKKARELDSDAFLRGAARTHWSNPDVKTPPPGEKKKGKEK